MKRLSANFTGTSTARRDLLAEAVFGIPEIHREEIARQAGRLGRMLSDEHSAAACSLAEGGTDQVLHHHREQRERGERRRAQGGVVDFMFARMP